MKTKDGKLNMHYGASPVIFERASELRARMTPAEELLWDALKSNEWRLNFRRQHPLYKYIADFYCHKVKLAIELDGGYHDNQDVKIYDEERELEINQFGIKVLRFRNEEIINNSDAVLKKIGEAITTIKNTPKEKAYSLNNSPLGAGGGAGGQTPQHRHRPPHPISRLQTHQTIFPVKYLVANFHIPSHRQTVHDLRIIGLAQFILSQHPGPFHRDDLSVITVRAPVLHVNKISIGQGIVLVV